MMMQSQGIFSASGQMMFTTKHDRLRNDLTDYYKKMVDVNDCRSVIQNVEEDVPLPDAYLVSQHTQESSMELEHNDDVASSASRKPPLEHQRFTLVKILIEVEVEDIEASRFNSNSNSNNQQIMRPMFSFGLPNLQQLNAVVAPVVKSRSSHYFNVYIPRVYPYEAPKVFIESLMSLSFLRARSPQNIDNDTGKVKLRILEADWRPIFSLDHIIFALENMLKCPEGHQTYLLDH